MIAAHTPGPWLVRASIPIVYALHDQPPRNRFSALMQAGRRDHVQHAELMANAMLCAAAPDMLAALKAIYDRHNAETMAQARAAIAKAEGRS